MKIESQTISEPSEGAFSIYAKAQLPTEFGHFVAYAFQHGSEKLNDIAIVRGNLRGKENIPTRIHSECLTGDVFHSLRCDCRKQLEAALQQFAKKEAGIILYMRQEGRGIGIANKIAAYKLQEEGLDTVEANLHLGFADDMRNYDNAARMLLSLGVKSIDLYTNNPLKVDKLEKAGIAIHNRKSIIIEPNAHNERYLRTKQHKSGHFLDFT